MEIIAVGYSKGSLGKNNGCEKAPRAIFKALEGIWTNEKGEELKYSLSELEVDKDLAKTIREIKFPQRKIFLGGDHSITYYLFKSFAEKFENPGLLVFDAHPDVFQESNRPTHQDWLSYLVDEGLVKANKVLLVGIRSSAKKEIEYLLRNKIRFITMKQLYDNFQLTCNNLLNMAGKFKSLYVSIDIDVIDPSCAPGTGYLEPGGLNSREFLYLIQRVSQMRNLKAIDLVEVNPELDINGLTVKLAAKILGELL